MPVKIPEPNLLDRLLRKCGKTRGVVIPGNTHCCHGKEQVVNCRKESILESILRSRNQELPSDRADIFVLQKIYRRSPRSRK